MFNSYNENVIFAQQIIKIVIGKEEQMEKKKFIGIKILGEL